MHKIGTVAYLYMRTMPNMVELTTVAYPKHAKYSSMSKNMRYTMVYLMRTIIQWRIQAV